MAVIEIAEKTGDILDVAEVLSAQRIPLGAKHNDGSFDVLYPAQMVGRARYPGKPFRAGARLGNAAYSLRRTSACQMQRAEPFRPVLGHALRCPTELARCKFLRERLF